MLRADLTRRSEAVSEFYKKFRVKGVPTLIFLRRDGSEIAELRGTGLETKDVFLEKMKRALELTRGNSTRRPLAGRAMERQSTE
jgi:thiol:disulfide interchange protein